MNYKTVFSVYGAIPPVRNTFERIIFSPIRYTYRRFFTRFYFPRVYKNACVYNDVAENTVISLTSFPQRFATLWLTIESLKHQTYKPEKIVLYLSTDEAKREDLPSSLVNEEDDIFEIRFRNGKYRAHGKYYFAVQEFPDKNVVTVDDDNIYPPNMLETLFKGHLKYPKYVITNNTHQILKDQNGEPLSYSVWKDDFSKSDFQDSYCLCDNLIPMGVGGVLYPPEVLYKDVNNFELAKKLSYLADDLWLYAMVVLNGGKVIKTSFNNLHIIPIDIKNSVTLTAVNVFEGRNDDQFREIRKYYIDNIGKDIVNLR